MCKLRRRTDQWLPGAQGREETDCKQTQRTFWDDGSTLKLDCGDCFITYKYIKTLELHIKIGEFHAR